MGVYYLLMALILGLAYPLCIRKPSAKKNIIYVCIVVGYMFLMSVFRYGIGNDFYSYRYGFYNYVESTESFGDRLKNDEFEIGYLLLMELGRLLGGDYLIFNLLVALAILVPTAAVIIKYSKMPWISCWLYLTVSFFYNSINFTRQTIGASIVLLSYGFMKKKKHWAVVLMIIAGSLFHKSILVALPIYLLSLIKPSAKLYAILGGMSVAAYFFSDTIIRLAVENLFPSYSKYIDTVYLSNGLSWVFVIVPFLITTLLMISYFTGMREKCPESGLLVNLSFFGCIIWLFITKHLILERFSLPIYIFTIISIPEALHYFRDVRFPGGKSKGAHFKPREEKKITKLLKYVFKNGKSLSGYVTAAVLLVTVTYNDFCIGQGVHGAFPYKSIFNAAPQYSEEYLQDRAFYIFQSKTLQEYFSMAERGDFTTVITVKGNAGSNLDISSKTILRKLGVRTDLNKLEGKSYIGVFSGGKSLYEAASEEILEEKLAICSNSVYVTVMSGGSSSENPMGRIIYNDIDYSPNVTGLNVAVFDNIDKKIIASQNFNTSTHKYVCTVSTAFIGEMVTEE